MLLNSKRKTCCRDVEPWSRNRICVNECDDCVCVCLVAWTARPCVSVCMNGLSDDAAANRCFWLTINISNRKHTHIQHTNSPTAHSDRFTQFRWQQRQRYRSFTKYVAMGSSDDRIACVTGRKKNANVTYMTHTHIWHSKYLIDYFFAGLWMTLL